MKGFKPWKISQDELELAVVRTFGLCGLVVVELESLRVWLRYLQLFHSLDRTVQSTQGSPSYGFRAVEQCEFFQSVELRDALKAFLRDVFGICLNSISTDVQTPE